jgi:hypothetical protein
MESKKKAKKALKVSPGEYHSAPLNFTAEHVRMAREGRSKEAFELLLAQKARKNHPVSE